MTKKNAHSKKTEASYYDPSKDTQIVYGLEESKYRAIEAVSYSDLKKFAESPREYFESKVNKENDSSDYLEIGSLLDDAIYSIEDFKKNFFRLPPGTKKAKASHVEEEFKLSVGASRELSSKVYDETLACAEALRAHKIVGEIIRRSDPKFREVSCFWVDKQTGLKLKSRLDLFDEKTAAIYDFKSTASDGTSYNYAKEFYKYGYHIQASFYPQGLRANGIEVSDFCHAVVSKETKLVYPYVIDQATILIGENQINTLLREMSRCIREKHWPYRGEQFQTLTLPSYAVTEIEQRLGLSA